MMANSVGATGVATASAACEQPPARPLRLLGILALLLGFASISTDLYLPALGAHRSVGR